MPRRNRCVLPDLPCHITQRGVDRREVFSRDQDRHTYLGEKGEGKRGQPELSDFSGAAIATEKSSGGNDTLYWYMTPGIVAESDLSGSTKSEYIFFAGERVARRDGVNGTGGVFYYFSDHLKTASVITESTGNIKAESDYYPWGGELALIANDSNHYKFTGKERDTETGLDYFGAQYYSNGLGRFTRPIGARCLHLFRMSISAILNH